MKADRITDQIIGCAISIHRALGPGLLEAAYQICLEHELNRQGFAVESQKLLPLIYNGIETKRGFQVDLLVEKEVVVEVMAQRQIAMIDEAQVQTYLKLLNCRIGLLLNFNTRWMTGGIHRVINPNYSERRLPPR